MTSWSTSVHFTAKMKYPWLSSGVERFINTFVYMYVISTVIENKTTS